MNTIALDDPARPLAGEHLARRRCAAHLRLLWRVAARVHTRREIAAVHDPRWRADIGVPPEPGRQDLKVVAMALWPSGS